MIMNTQQQVIRTNEIAKEIYQQLKFIFGMNTLWSWGMAEQRAMNFRNMPALGIRVNGYQHKGWVVIALNEGKDLYNIYLLDNLQHVKQTIEDVFVEDLEILDSLIETGEMTEQEYINKVKNTYS